jgi:hypothetical protein
MRREGSYFVASTDGILFTIGALSKEKGYSATSCSVLVLTMTDYQVTYRIHPSRLS